MKDRIKIKKIESFWEVTLDQKKIGEIFFQKIDNGDSTYHLCSDDYRFQGIVEANCCYWSVEDVLEDLAFEIGIREEMEAQEKIRR